MKKIIYILGSPYTGSSLISENLAKYDGVLSLGESHRYRIFKQFEHEKTHYLDECTYCSTQKDNTCPIWNSNDTNDKFSNILKNTQEDIIIDSSKEVDWFIKHTHIVGFDSYALILTKNPVGFVSSNIKRRSDLHVFEHAQGWRNTYEYILNMTVRSKRPYILIKYEDYLKSPVEVESRILNFINSDIKRTKKDISNSHPLGGNIIYLASQPQFNLENIETNIAEDDFGMTLIKSKNFRKKDFNEIKERVINNISKKDINTIISVPNLLYIASFLGYNVSEILAVANQSRRV